MGRKKMTPETPAEGSPAAAPTEKFNKSARIRELFDAGRSAKEIKQSLDADGHETTVNTVYTTIATYKKKKAAGGMSSSGNKPRGRQPGSKNKPKEAASTGGAQGTGSPAFNGRYSIQDIQTVAEFAKTNGGYDSLIALLQAMKSL